MRTSKKLKKAVTEIPAARSLKIQPRILFDKYRDAHEVAEIRLCGNWLENWGFTAGKRVELSLRDGTMTIKLQP